MRRDPASDPQPGDLFVKRGASFKELRRYVRLRTESQVGVSTTEDGEVRMMWLNTFQDWARGGAEHEQFQILTHAG